MILSEKYLAQFERSSGLKKGTVGNLNHLYETYMSDARDNGDDYKFFMVMDINGQAKIIGGNEYRQDAIDATKEYLESGIRLKVYALKYLQGKNMDPEDDSNWGNQDDINLAMQAAGGGQQMRENENAKPDLTFLDKSREDHQRSNAPDNNHITDNYFTTIPIEDPQSNYPNYHHVMIVAGFEEQGRAEQHLSQLKKDGVNAILQSRTELAQYGIDPEENATWASERDIDMSRMMASNGGQQQMQQEGVAGVPSQQDVDAFQASEYEGNDEPENDKDADSQDALHLGEDSTPLGLAHGHLNTAGEERRKAMTGQMNSLKRDRYVNSALNQLGHASQEKAFNDNPQKADSDRAKTYAAQGKTGRVIPENESGFGEDEDAPEEVRWECDRCDGEGYKYSPHWSFDKIVNTVDCKHCGGKGYTTPNDFHDEDDDGDAAYDAHRDSMLGEIDNMMGGNDAPSAPDTSGGSMGSGDEWMDEPNANQMNSLGEGMAAPDLNGSRAASARELDNAAFYRNKSQGKGMTPKNKSDYARDAKSSIERSVENRAGKYGYKATHLPEQAQSLNEDSKALYAKAKVSEAEYERFLRNAGIKK